MTDPRRSQAIQAVQKAGAKICDAVLQYEVGQGSSAWNELVIARSKLMVALDALAAVPPAELQEGERPTTEELAAILTDPDMLAGKYLPPEEQEAHRRALESVIEARRVAPGNEGQLLVSAVQSSPDPVRAAAQQIVGDYDRMFENIDYRQWSILEVVEVLRAALGSVREPVREEWQALANQCRHTNKGYDDGQSGTIDDVRTLLDENERSLRSFGQSISNLHTAVRKPGPNVTEEMIERIYAVRDRINLINTDVDRPSAQLDGPDLEWAYGELTALVAILKEKNEVINATWE